jgi:hypothetical protein
MRVQQKMCTNKIMYIMYNEVVFLFSQVIKINNL